MDDNYADPQIESRLLNMVSQTTHGQQGKLCCFGIVSTQGSMALRYSTSVTSAQTEINSGA